MVNMRRKFLSCLLVALLSIGAFNLAFGVNSSPANYWSFGNNSYLNFSEAVTFNDYLPQGVSADSNLVGYWNMNDASGEVVSDSSGKGNNGIIHGALSADGKYGNSVSFNASKGDYIELPASNALIFGNGSFTLAAWVKITNFNYGDRITLFGGNSSLAPAMCVYKDGSLLTFSQMGQASQISGLSVPIGAWAFLAIVVNKNSDTISYFVNNHFETQVLSSSFLTFTKQLNGIGTCLGINTRFMNGLIDEARIYNRTLSTKEINTLYVMGPFSQPNAFSFANYYNFTDSNSANTMLIYVGSSFEGDGNSGMVTCVKFFTDNKLTFRANKSEKLNIWTNLGQPESITNGIWNDENFTITFMLNNNSTGELKWAAEEAPSVSNLSISSVIRGKNASFSALWSDNQSLSGGGYIFSTNNTGSWLNASWVSFSSPNLCLGNVSLSLNSSQVNIGFREYANNSINLWGDSGIFTITTQSDNSTLTPSASSTPTASPTTMPNPNPQLTPAPNSATDSPSTLNNMFSVETLVPIMLALVVLFAFLAVAFKKGDIRVEITDQPIEETSE